MTWYDHNKRDLPWRRRTGDAYAQWVAEVMLQQTRVETVLRYYEPFLKRYPCVSRLARAPHEEVLKAWEGLGYYRRILHLHRAARDVRAAGRGVPASFDDLRRLPGIGAYTAAAIASIAYGEPVAAVDGNVARVLGRMMGIQDPRLPAARQQIQSAADQLLSVRRPGDFNQAWMDLGSAICQPRSPRCPECPLADYCATARHGRSQPARTQKTVPRLELAVGVFRWGDRMFMRRRKVGGLWSGLWEFPMMEAPSGVTPRTIRRMAADNGLQNPGTPEEVGAIEHRLTHRRLVLRILSAPTKRSSFARGSSRWVTTGAFERLPVSTAHRRVHQAFRQWLDRNGHQILHPQSKYRRPGPPEHGARVEA